VKPFLLFNYAEAMARASPTRRPTSIPCRCHLVDPRVLDFLNIGTTDDISFPQDSSEFGSSSFFGEIFEHRSSMSRRCSDDSMSPSS
jgi:hypothetical protein